MQTLEINPIWNSAYPELCHIVNGVSFLMPHMEPFVTKTMREHPNYAHDSKLQQFCVEEDNHQAAHHEFNKQTSSRYWTFSIINIVLVVVFWMFSKLSWKNRLILSYSFESFALTAAKWSEIHQIALFNDAAAEVTDLFTWHFDEEYEHRETVWEQLQEHPVSVFRKLIGLTATWAVIGSTVVLSSVGGLLHPGTIKYLRSIPATFTWYLSFFLFGTVDMVFSMLPKYLPEQVIKPVWFTKTFS